MPTSNPATFASTLTAIAVLWLATGGALLAFTPLPAHTSQLGWGPLYWLVLAPACILAGLRLRASPARPLETV